MKCLFVLVGILTLLGAGCVDTFERLEREAIDSMMPVTMPTENYTFRVRYKRFGEFFDDRFRGYHVGDDLEADDWWNREMRNTGLDLEEYISRPQIEDREPTIEDMLGSYAAIQAVADGRVTFADWVPGYGGVIVINHAAMCNERPLDTCERVSAVYGHLNAKVFRVAVGDTVEQGQVIGYLGVEGPQTDDERAHLHFAIYKGDDVRLAGYVASPSALADYINPRTFFSWYGLDGGRDDTMRQLSRLTEPSGRDTFPLEMRIPETWDVEWVPSLQAWNLYDTRGEGAARERSQIFISFFDAAQFLTLPTVDVFETTDTTVGQGYAARRYDIQKKAGVADFVDQPSWRNERHIVTDFRVQDGQTRYYVVAARPDLLPETYAAVLDSIVVGS